MADYLTIALCLVCFDDQILGRVLPSKARFPPAASRFRRGLTYALVLAVGVLSVRPVVNLLSARQKMNASYEPLHLVNTYGMFGGITRDRQEVVIEGTADTALSVDTIWREYELPAKPGDPRRRPRWVSPYQLHLDWQLWFAAMSPYWQNPWFVHLWPSSSKATRFWKRFRH